MTVTNAASIRSPNNSTHCLVAAIVRVATRLREAGEQHSPTVRKLSHQLMPQGERERFWLGRARVIGTEQGHWIACTAMGSVRVGSTATPVSERQHLPQPTQTCTNTVTASAQCCQGIAVTTEKPQYATSIDTTWPVINVFKQECCRLEDHASKEEAVPPLHIP